MKFHNLSLFLILSSTAGFASAQGINGYPKGTYVCTTAEGRHLTSDRPIPECLNREQRILGRSGLTLAVVRPSPPPQNQQQQNTQQQQQQEEQRLTALARRLYTTYPTRSSHQAIRQQELKPLTSKLQDAQTEMSELRRQQQNIEQEILAISNPKSIPASLLQRQEFAQRNIIIQQGILDDLETQITNVNNQFTKEENLLTPLWNGDIPHTATP